MYIEPQKLKTFIADSGLVSKKDLDIAEEEAERKNTDLATILTSQGKVTDEDIARMKAYILGIPFVNLKGQKIDIAVLSVIPEPIARSHNIVAFKKTLETLEVAMLDTDDFAAIDFIKKKTGLKIIPRLTSPESIKSVLLLYQRSLKAEFGDIIEKESSAIKMLQDESGDEPVTETELKKLAEDLPVVRIIDTLLKHAIIQNASDIHIEPTEREVVVRYRIDGILHDTMILPKRIASSIVARVKVLSSLRLDEKRLPQDGRFKVETEADKVSFRVSVLPTYYGEKIVMRLLRENVSGFTLEVIGFHGKALERIYSATKQKTGMILTTGPTGSGKSTTLYTVLDILNTPDVNISTIEDPIEYQMRRINQTQVKPEIGFTFASGLRSLMRQDPDIIMVGEIRDNETVSLAVNASLTGHLVLSTLHTNSAAGAIPRMLDMKVEPFLLVSTVNVVIGQRLVRRLCNKTRYVLSKSEFASLAKKVDMERILTALKEEKVVRPADTWETISFYKPEKSDECPDGYGGRVGLYEVFQMSSAIKDIILKNGTSDEIEVQARKEGMMTMLEDGIFKAVQGLTTLEEVFRVVSE
jgi:type IV pilus assembly protein PilB